MNTSDETLLHELRRAAHLYFLVMCLLALAAALWHYTHMWWYAWSSGLLPSAWNPPEAPHGPWRRLWSYVPNHPGRYFVFVQFDLLFATASGTLSVLFRPSIQRAIIPLVSAVLCVSYFFTHSWLVD